MLAKRIIPCLDVKNNQVVKGIKFRQHRKIGNILELAQKYSDAGADELVFYDILASSHNKQVDPTWINDIAKVINIPFCVAGGIRTLAAAEQILYAGADKISINSPALENPQLINQLVDAFGQQCIVIGIDSLMIDDTYEVYQYTGDPDKTQRTKRTTKAWISEVQDRGAGEIVLNCMDQDGVRAGYDIAQLQQVREITKIPLIASGGAGQEKHFLDVFACANVDGALAASVFHNDNIAINDLKSYLEFNNVEVRL